FGLRRIGVAVGQQVTNSASAVGVVANGNEGPDWQGLQRIIAEWQPARIIVGMPTHADGTQSDTSTAVERFIGELGRFGKPIETTDENYTSREAGALLKDQRARGLRGRARKGTLDSTAAKLIAERWLAGNRQSNR
ncbi:MAG: Holliday junction resolvase RuvX, partial [Gammaproteobacteria bacterium]|nr:Holliday junction resolvase RuvX [Gammaproteobacteria bacterium]